MNIRKPADYTTMFAALDALMAAQLPQMELYCEIGRVVSGRSEKGAAVAASEYLQAAYPATEGFSPRNLRRKRSKQRKARRLHRVLLCFDLLQMIRTICSHSRMCFSSMALLS